MTSVVEIDSFSKKFSEAVSRTPGNEIKFIGFGVQQGDVPTHSLKDLSLEIERDTRVGRLVRETIEEVAGTRGKSVEQMIEIFAQERAFGLKGAAEYSEEKRAAKKSKAPNSSVSPARKTG